MDLLEAFCWDEEEAEARKNTIQLSPKMLKIVNKQIKTNKKLQKQIDRYKKRRQPIPQYLQDELKKQELISKDLLDKIRSV